MPSREKTLELLDKYIQNPSLKNHCLMVAAAMEAYAKFFNLSPEEIEKWWIAGAVHDIDWEMFPETHPLKAVNEILPNEDYDQEIIDAVKAHAPDRTGKNPETQIEKYLFACDEICGFLFATALIRPTGFEGMEHSSIKKRLKDKRFAAGVNREDVYKGSELIEKELSDHVTFLIQVFSDWKVR
jgi:predicted hydrolase (HD superfamily)